MISSKNSERTIVLRNRTINKKLNSQEKSEILKSLILKVNNSANKTEECKKVFDFFCLECVDDKFFRRKNLLDVIKIKLNEFALRGPYCFELSTKYMCAIFPRSARNEYILLRYKRTETCVKKIKNIHSMYYVTWICLRAPARAFRTVMDFIGPSYYST